MEPIVLLVDDDENLLRGLVRVLHRQPFRLYTARSGEEAVAVVKAHPVDVLVTDQRMPGISGNDLLAWVAKHAPDVMRIVLTGHATTDAVIRAVNEGRVFQYFTKPCRELDLAIAIHKAIDYRTLSRENRRLTEEGRQWREQRREVRHFIDQIRRILAGPLRRRLAWLAGWHRAETPGDAVLSEADAYALMEEALELLDETERIVTELRTDPSLQSMGAAVVHTGPCAPTG
ncbi:MAG: response regulator [Thermoguttaceae bacterium]